MIITLVVIIIGLLYFVSKLSKIAMNAQQDLITLESKLRDKVIDLETKRAFLTTEQSKFTSNMTDDQKRDSCRTRIKISEIESDIKLLESINKN